MSDSSENTNRTVRLTKGKRTFRGAIEQDFELGGEAQFDNPFEQYLDDKSQKLAQGTAVFNSMFKGFDVSPIQLKTRLNTISLWTGSQRPPIPIPFTVVRRRMSQPSVTSITSYLISQTFPESTEPALTGFLTAPGGYKITDDGNAEGTWIVSVGNWFRATGLILRSANFTHSKAVVGDDTPLYATGTLTFEPYRAITASEFRAWFRYPSDKTVADSKQEQPKGDAPTTNTASRNTPR